LCGKGKAPTGVLRLVWCFLCANSQVRLLVVMLDIIQENRRYCNKNGYNSYQKIEYAYNFKEVVFVGDSFNHYESPEGIVARTMSI
jgi:hypothetical protein